MGERLLSTEYHKLICKSCDRKLYAYKARFDRAKAEGLSDEEALFSAGLHSICCRTAFLTPSIVPTASSYYDPDVMKGIKAIELSTEERTKKWQGNMLRVGTEEGQILTVDSGDLPSRTISSDYKMPGLVIPEGWEQTGWRKVDNSFDGTGKQLLVPVIRRKYGYWKSDPKYAGVKVVRSTRK